MIRVDTNEFVVGSKAPTSIRYTRQDTPIGNDMADEYLLSSAWESGGGVLLVGPPLSGKTTMGLNIVRRVAFVAPLLAHYWTEADFLADLRNLWRLEEMCQKVTRDEALWGEFLTWERDFWDHKESPLLFLDDIGRGYTAMHAYEVENLIRHRNDLGLTTIMGSSTAHYDNLSASLKGAMTRNAMVIRLGGI